MPGLGGASNSPGAADLIRRPRAAHRRRKEPTMRLPREIGPIHFVGIGGIGMSGIAEGLCNLRYNVQGSGPSESGNVARPREKGVKVSVGHKAGNVHGPHVVVVSPPVKRENPKTRE